MNANRKVRPTLPERASPVALRDGAKYLDIHRYAPFLLNAVNGTWQRKTSAIYRAKYDIGIVDWRVLSMLMIEPGITAHRICEAIRLDKAAVSRALKQLQKRGLLAFEASPSDERKRYWRLTEDGQVLHDEILVVALDCEAQMVAGVEPEDMEAYLRVMSRFLSNLEQKAPETNEK